MPLTWLLKSMCLSPIVIPNKTRRFVRGLSRPLLTVPCGHCAECAQRKQDDWFVRAIYETRRVESLGGAVWVPILTYRNEDLPTYDDPSYKDGYHIPCFSPVHIKRFRDRLRMYFKRHYHVEAKGIHTIRYISCSEYGDKKGRSHCHMLLFVPFEVPARFMKAAIAYAWTYGMVRYSRLGMMASGLRAARYAMKYVAKDMCWSNKYHTDEYEQWLKENMKSAMTFELSEVYHEKLKAFRRVKPRHFQSMGFGIDGISYFRSEDGSWNTSVCVDGKLDSSKLGIPPLKSGEQFAYNMPDYYVRKVFYSQDDWNLYRLTPFGKEIFAMRFERGLQTKADMYSVYLNAGSCSEHLDPLPVNGTELSMQLQSLMDGRTAYDLALFDTVYRDIELNEVSSALYVTAPDRESLSFLDDNALDFMLAQKSIDREPDPERSVTPSNWKIADNTFNNLHCFRDFVTVLGVISEHEKLLGAMEQKAAEVQRQRNRNLGVYLDNTVSSNQMFCDL